MTPHPRQSALEAAHAEVTRTYQELLKAANLKDSYAHLRASERHAAAQQRYIKAKENER